MRCFPKLAPFAMVGVLAGATVALALPAEAQQLPDGIPPGIELPPPLDSIPLLPGGTDPASLDPTPATEGSVPPGSSLVPEGEPALPEVDGLTPLPGQDGDDGETGGSETQDPCAQATGPLTEAGAPVAAECGITPTDEGGVDIQLCLTVAQLATCERGASSTPPPTTPPSDPSDDTGGAGGSGAGTSRTANASAAAGTDPGSDTGGAGGGGTLPFTGSSAGALLALGTALTAVGGILTRALRASRA